MDNKLNQHAVNELTVQLNFLHETMRYTAAMLAEYGIEDKASEVAGAADMVVDWINGIREDCE